MLSAKAFRVESIPAYQVVKFIDVVNIPEEDIIICISLGYEEEDNIVNKYRSTKLSLDEVCYIRKNLP